MVISAEFLWIIYGVTFLFLAILAAGAASRNPGMNIAGGVAIAAFVALVVVYTVVLLCPLAFALPADRESANTLMLVGGILFGVALLVALVMAVKGNKNAINYESKAEVVSGVIVEVECDDEDNCDIKGISQMQSSDKGVHFMSFKENDETEMMSPVGYMKIEPLA